MAAIPDDEAEITPTAPTGSGLPKTPRKREAEEWALVLVAEGFAPQLLRLSPGWSIAVEAGRTDEAAEIIAAWREERAERNVAPTGPPARSATSLEITAAYACALGFLAFHLGLETSGQHAAFVEAGKSRAALVMAGELWRTVTALTLHADLAHVVGNTLFGGFFLTALAGRLGLGCAALAFLVSGTLGNLANAIYYGHAHSSVGASTGVFGLVGVLAGLAAWQRHQTARHGRGAWVAFAAGLAIVAMLGSGGPRVDFSAHLFGLAAGALTGVMIALPLSRVPRPGAAIQLTAGLGALVIVLACWSQAGTWSFGPPA